MATRQYIGARYVPVFADPVQWDDDRAYEPLMMVQSAGETYITKQATPIGAQLPDISQGEEDNEYWVHMSNWNAQIEVYRQEVLQYNGRISALELKFDENGDVAANLVNTASIEDGAVTTAKIADANVTTAKIADANVTTAKIADSNVTTAKIADSNVTTAKIADANVTTSKIANGAITPEKLAQKKMIVFGDSYSASATNTDKWMGYFLRLHPEIEMHNYSAGGASIYANLDGQVDTAIADSSFTNTSIEYVLIFMGVNDRFQAVTAANALTALANAVYKIRNNFPNADIQYVFNTSTPIYEAMYELGLTLVDGIIAQQGIKACTMFGWLKPTDYGADYIHPSTTGYSRIAANINALYCGGSVEYVQYRATCNLTNYTNCTAPSTVEANFYVKHLNDHDVDMVVTFNTPTGSSNSASFETPDVNTFGLGIITERFLGYPFVYANNMPSELTDISLRASQHLVTLSPQDFRFKFDGRIMESDSTHERLLFFDTFSRKVITPA